MISVMYMEQSDVKERILNAALRVVNRNTISGTRMHLIAHEAGMVQSNVHYYYKTKEELMLALQGYILDECTTFREREKRSCHEELESQLDVFFQQKKKLILNKGEYDFAEIDFWVQGRINKEVREKFQNNYSKWREEIRQVLDKYCQYLDNCTRERLPYVVVSMLEGATIQYGIDSENFDIDGYFEFCKRMILKETAYK
jgi:AcrR family transcriptional regulator